MHFRPKRQVREGGLQRCGGAGAPRALVERETWSEAVAPLVPLACGAQEEAVMHAAAIVRIVEVVDTRQYEEQGDRWVPIPGSGNLNECARCGRMHEVHASVELSDGTSAVVGTGCMNAESTEIASKLKSAASRAKRIAKHRAEISKLEKLAAEHVRIRAIVNAMPLPAVVASSGSRSVGREREEHAIYSMGETKVWDFCAPGTPISKDRLYSLTSCWRDDQAKAMGETYAHVSAEQYLKETRRLLAKLEAK